MHHHYQRLVVNALAETRFRLRRKILAHLINEVDEIDFHIVLVVELFLTKKENGENVGRLEPSQLNKVDEEQRTANRQLFFSLTY